jgi:hypothetical protein
VRVRVSVLGELFNAWLCPSCGESIATDVETIVLAPKVADTADVEKGGV